MTLFPGMHHGGHRSAAVLVALAHLSACSYAPAEPHSAENGDGFGEDGSGSEGPGQDGEGSGGGGDEGPAGTTGGGDQPPPPPEEPPVVDAPNDVCDDSEPVTLFLSPDDSNSMSSPVQARAALLSAWGSLSSIGLRPWEFLNYYTFDYPPAEPGSIAVHTSLYVEEDAAPGEYLLQIGVASEFVDPAERPPINLTFVLDTSGSMGGLPLELMQETGRVIAANLREGDIVSMVTWSTSNNVVLEKHPIAGPDDPTLLSAIAELDAGGSTNLHGGLVAGYQLATEARRPDMVNRILLVSDGGANAGVTDTDVIAQHAGGQNEDGIYLVGVGVGTPETYYDALMDEVTDVGKGASVFIPDVQEARKIFGERFVSTLAVAARDVQVKLDLPPGFEVARFSGEEISHDPSEVEPQHLAPNDAMVFHQRLHTCAPELVDLETPITVTVRYKDAITFEEHEVEHATTFGELLDQDPSILWKGAAVFEYATALAAVRDGIDAEAAVERAFAALERAREVLVEDPELAEIEFVLGALPAY